MSYVHLPYLQGRNPSGVHASVSDRKKLATAVTLGYNIASLFSGKRKTFAQGFSCNMKIVMKGFSGLQRGGKSYRSKLRSAISQVITQAHGAWEPRMCSYVCD